MISGYAHIAAINSYTCRGYRYDSEIGMYYLNSRYYNPEIGRFINSDGLLGLKGDILTTNMYAYAVNNPVTNTDPSGEFVSATVIATVVSVLASLISKLIEDVLYNLMIGYTGLDVFKHLSPMAHYLSRAISGGISSLITKVNPILGRIVDGLLVPGLDQLFEIIAGKRTAFNEVEFVSAAMIRISTGILTFKIPVKSQATIMRIVNGTLTKVVGKMYTTTARALIRYIRT